MKINHSLEQKGSVPGALRISPARKSSLDIRTRSRRTHRVAAIRARSVLMTSFHRTLLFFYLNKKRAGVFETEKGLMTGDAAEGRSIDKLEKFLCQGALLRRSGHGGELARRAQPKARVRDFSLGNLERRRDTKFFQLISFLLIVQFCFGPMLRAEEMNFAQVEKPAKNFFVGERLTYVVSYLGIPVGQADSEVKEMVELNGRKAYHIVVYVKSYPILDWIYKVRDEHHTFMDAEHFYSLQYEKILSEGRYRANEVMTYDQENHTAHFYSRLNKSEKEMFIPRKVQDQLSCGYYFRTLEVKPNTTVTIPVNADEKNWELEIDLFEVNPMEIKEVGKFDALAAEPKIKFQGIFVKRGKINGWISMDERRIPLRMQVKIPILGSVIAQLSDYKPGQAQTNFPQ